MTKTTDLIFAGVGGQGVLLIAEITALTAARAGFDVKQTEVHGVSQRGGSVESHVRFGEVVHSPLVTAGQADVVIGLEKLEGLRYSNFLNRLTGVLLVNDHEIIPGSVANAAEKYPHHSIDFLRSKNIRTMALPASRLALELGDGRMANIVLLGALSALLGLPAEGWQETLHAKLPTKYRDANLRAFEVGKESAAVQVV